jgi:hypothetical protein
MSKYSKRKAYYKAKRDLTGTFNIIGGLVLLAVFLSTWFIVIPLGIVYLAYLVFSRTNFGRGWLGEYQVRRIIGANKPSKNKYVINNITFHDGSKSVQIDHLIINPSGIIVIETKNRVGKIYGKEDDLNWTIVYKYGKEKATMFNPVKQNEGHLKSLEKVLSIDVPLYSVIVFTKNADLREISTQSTPVVYANSLKQFIKDYSANDSILSPEQVLDIYNQLKELKENNKITNKEHVDGINQRMKARKKK